MGQSENKPYAVPISNAKEGETAIYRSPFFKNMLLESPDQNIQTIKELYEQAFIKNAKRPALGVIHRQNGKEEIKCINYQTLDARSKDLGSGIIHKRLGQGDGTLQFIGIFSKNRLQWILTDLACLWFNLVLVPLYAPLGNQNVSYIIERHSMKTCFCDIQSIKILKNLTNLSQLEYIVTFDQLSPQIIQQLQVKHIKIIPFSDLQFIGKQNRIDWKQDYQSKATDCYTISYTSGTTGPPKGVMYSHKNFTAIMAVVTNHYELQLLPTDVCLSYLPLAHILQRFMVSSMMFSGGKVVFYSGNLQRLQQDLPLAKPTIFLSVPRLFNRLYDILRNRLQQAQGTTKTLIDKALHTKLDLIAGQGLYTHVLYDQLVFSKTKMIFGGKMRLMISTSAPLRPEVQNFLKAVICCPLLQAYGQTQSTGGSFVTKTIDPLTKHVGGPLPIIEFKLVSIPQMNYLITDCDKSNLPTPRGQIWLRGPGVCLGYYNDKELTKQAITKDGWLKTGDIGELLPLNKALRIIDRKKNIFKLQQGQYVSPQRIQNIYMKSKRIQQIYVHGQSTQSYAVAIIVPIAHEIERIGTQMGKNEDFSDLCRNKEIRKQFLSRSNKDARDCGAKGFQLAHNVYFELNKFSQLGILNHMEKLQRFVAKKHYAKPIQDMYKEGFLV